MDNFIEIEKITGRQVLDSRGNPTVEVEVEARARSARAIVPSGASTGGFEAHELRDNNQKEYLGKGVKNAVLNVNTIIADIIEGMNVFEQVEIDNTLIEIDGTPNKTRLGANAILGVSLAVAKLAAKLRGMPLYRYVGGVNAKTMPIPMMNILNGGKHADNNINIQEFMIMPTGANTFEDGLKMGAEVYHTLKKVLKQKGYNTAIGDEGGFAPNLNKDEEALENIIEAIEKTGYKPGEDFKIALDVAGTEMLRGEKYVFWKTGEEFTKKELVQYFEDLTKRYPITSIEDPFAEEDFEGWKMITEKLANKIQIVGDDLFVTNKDRIQKGIKQHLANAVLIKPNQIGTLTETLDAIQIAQKACYKTIMSHRSGETEDTTIADLAVATNAGQIKTGAPKGTERTAKYNQLLRIEEALIG